MPRACEVGSPNAQGTYLGTVLSSSQYLEAMHLHGFSREKAMRPRVGFCVLCTPRIGISTRYIHTLWIHATESCSVVHVHSAGGIQEIRRLKPNYSYPGRKIIKPFPREVICSSAHSPLAASQAVCSSSSCPHLPTYRGRTRLSPGPVRFGDRLFSHSRQPQQQDREGEWSR